MALKLHNKSQEKAEAYLTDYSCNNANLVVAAWWKLGDDLLVKYNHLGRYNVETRRGGRIEYPKEWIRSLVKDGDLKPQPSRR